MSRCAWGYARPTLPLSRPPQPLQSHSPVASASTLWSRAVRLPNDTAVRRATAGRVRAPTAPAAARLGQSGASSAAPGPGRSAHPACRTLELAPARPAGSPMQRATSCRARTARRPRGSALLPRPAVSHSRDPTSVGSPRRTRRIFASGLPRLLPRRQQPRAFRPAARADPPLSPRGQPHLPRRRMLLPTLCAALRCEGLSECRHAAGPPLRRTWCPDRRSRHRSGARRRLRRALVVLPRHRRRRWLAQLQAACSRSRRPPRRRRLRGRRSLPRNRRSRRRAP